MGAHVRHFISLENWSEDELIELLDLAERQKQDPSTYRGAAPLAGKVIGLFFEKPSLRTKLGFEVAVFQLGGQVIYIGPGSLKLGKRESVKDFAKVSARFLDAMVLRTLRHETILEVVEHVDVPVINGLSDKAHPCQAIADLLTMREKKGRLEGIKVAYVGDANNVCRSLACAVTKCGGQIVIAAPEGYRLEPSYVRSLGAGGNLKEVSDPVEAVEGADVIYTDVWTSMGQEEEAEKRTRVFQPYRVNQALVERAPKAIVMHCLPAHRGFEITDEVIDGPQSVVYDQAENRLHFQRALLCKLFASDI